MDKSVLVLGAGRSLEQRVFLTPALGKTFSANFGRVVTLDIEPLNKPDIVASLNVEWAHLLRGEEFDEVHAYECLHLLSDFFLVWREIWKATKLNGFVVGTTPWWESKWAWQDPATKDVYTPERLWYLDQQQYNLPMMTNYSRQWPHPFSFKTCYAEQRGADPKTAGFTFVLKKEESSGDSDEQG